MSDEVKKGNYKEFNARDASWICPNCHRDALKLEDHYRYHGNLKVYHTFFCVYCGFDSGYYGIKIKNNDSFNSAHTKLLRDWSWIKFLLKKGYNEGIKDAEKKHADEKKLDAILDEFSTLLDSFVMGQ